MNSPPTYRPALRGLVFGLAALALRGVALVTLALTLGEDFNSGKEATEAMQWMVIVLTVVHQAGTCAAVVGVAYSAIAAHRREWGVMLVLAWIFSLLGIFIEIQTFSYATF